MQLMLYGIFLPQAESLQWTLYSKSRSHEIHFTSKVIKFYSSV